MFDLNIPGQGTGFVNVILEDRTCHPHFAEEAARYLDAEYLGLATLREDGPKTGETAVETATS